jgi:hypothetical protein
MLIRSAGPSRARFATYGHRVARSGETFTASDGNRNPPVKPARHSSYNNGSQTGHHGWRRTERKEMR